MQYSKSFRWKIDHVSATLCRWVIILSGFIFLLPSDILGEETQLTLEDLHHLVNVSDPQITPDGTQIVVVVTRPNFKENRYENELVLVDIATKSQRVLIYDRPRVRIPRWSPSGDRLAFLAADDEGTAQIFVMPMSGGDAKQITETPNGVQYLSWRPPKGQEIAFVTTDEDTSTREDDHNLSFEVGNNSYLTKSAVMPSHLWLVSVTGDTVQRLTSGKAGVNIFFQKPFDWAPDGQSIAFNCIPKPHSGEFVQNTIHLYTMHDQNRQVLVDEPPVELVGIASDGQQIVYYQPAGPELWYSPQTVNIYNSITGTTQHVSGELGRDVWRTWLLDSQTLLLMAPDSTRLQFWHQSVSGVPSAINLGDMEPAYITNPLTIDTSGALVLVGVTPQHPPELYYMASVHAPPSRLTEFNTVVASRRLASVETITWEGPDGFHENGVLYFPPNYDSSRTYPLVLLIRGGPPFTSVEGFQMLPHLMASQGWLVFDPNYRGSNNMGQEFQRAIINDAGDGPARDIMAGVAALKATWKIDNQRIAVSGWSYGGFLTTWLLGHYHDWTTAIVGAAVTDWFDEYSLSDFNIFWKYALGGSPWVPENLQNTWAQSPIRYAADIQTPTLIMATTGDERAPITNSYKLFHALQDNNVPVQFIAYPTPGHFPPDPVHQQDVFRRWIDWIETHFEQVENASESASQQDK